MKPFTCSDIKQFRLLDARISIKPDRFLVLLSISIPVSKKF